MAKFRCETPFGSQAKLPRISPLMALTGILGSTMLLFGILSQSLSSATGTHAGGIRHGHPVDQGWFHPPALRQSGLPTDSRSSDKYMASLIVIVSGAFADAMRAVQLLRGSVYDGLPPVSLGLCVRASGPSTLPHQQLSALKALAWQHGPFAFVVQENQLSELQRLTQCSDKLGLSRPVATPGRESAEASADSLIVVLSNVDKLSRYWAQWLVRAAGQYRSTSHLRSFSLLQAPRTADAGLTLGSLTVAHKLMSFSGMSTPLGTWQAYVAWAGAGHGSNVVDGVSTFNDFCKEHDVSTVYSNLGESLTWMTTVSNAEAAIEVVPFWRREYAAFPANPLRLDRPTGALAWQAAASTIETDALKVALSEAAPPGADSFAGLTIINAAFVDMTLSWLCNTARMPGVHERSVMVCTDQECLFRMRTSPVAARVSSVLGLNLFLRTAHVPGADAMRSAEQEAGALRYATVHYILMMIARQQLLADLVLSGVPYLLFETDALWADDAYSWLGRALASGKVWDRQRKEGRPAGLPAFDFIGYVDGGTRGIGGGFFLTFATQEARALCSLWNNMMQSEIGKIKNISDHHAGMHIDQRTLKHAFNLFDANGSVAIFPPPLFPSGKWYRSRNTSEGDLAHVVSEGIVVLQFNWIVGVQAKVERAVDYGHWFLEKGGVCNETAAAILQAARSS